MQFMRNFFARRTYSMASLCRSLGLTLLGLLLGAAVWAAPSVPGPEAAAQQVVIDTQQSKVSHLALRVMHPNVVLQQLVSPPLLDRLARLAPEPVKVLRALQAAPISELALSGLVEDADVVMAVRLPEVSPFRMSPSKWINTSATRIT